MEMYLIEGVAPQVTEAVLSEMTEPEFIYSHSPNHVAARRAYVYRAYHKYGATVRELADMFEKTNIAIYKMLARTHKSGPDELDRTWIEKFKEKGW